MNSTVAPHPAIQQRKPPACFGAMATSHAKAARSGIQASGNQFVTSGGAQCSRIFRDRHRSGFTPDCQQYNLRFGSGTPGSPPLVFTSLERLFPRSHRCFLVSPHRRHLCCRWSPSLRLQSQLGAPGDLDTGGFGAGTGTTHTAIGPGYDRGRWRSSSAGWTHRGRRDMPQQDWTMTSA